MIPPGNRSIRNTGRNSFGGLAATHRSLDQAKRYRLFYQSGLGEDVDGYSTSPLRKICRLKITAALSPALHLLRVCSITRACWLAQSSINRVDLEIAERQSLNQPPERPSVGRVAEQDFWVWLGARMKDEKEQKVLYGSFVLDLKPREIFDHYNQLFSNVHEVYRLKENILARLRRDTEITAYLQGDA